jgi:hypothetical protein
MYPSPGFSTLGSASSAVTPQTTLVFPTRTTVPNVVLERFICESVTCRDSRRERPDGRIFRSRCRRRNSSGNSFLNVLISKITLDIRRRECERRQCI